MILTLTLKLVITVDLVSPHFKFAKLGFGFYLHLLLFTTRSVGALWAPTSSLRAPTLPFAPFGRSGRETHAGN